MAKLMKCRALVEFRINTPNQSDGVTVKPGVNFLFDGFNATVMTNEGLPRKLAAFPIKKMKDEWYEEICEVNLPSQTKPVELTPEEQAIAEELTSE